MNTAAQQQFDADYATVRRLVLKGTYSVDIAKMWIVKHGKLAACGVMSEQATRSLKIMSRGVERELEQMQAWDKRMGYDKENDDE